MQKGDVVTVISCSVCEAVQGLTATVKEVNEAGDKVRLSFGKGRPQRNRPEWFEVSGLQPSVGNSVGLQVNGKK
jgi:hypothetical protein